MSATDSGIVSVGETVVTEEKGVKIPLSSQMSSPWLCSGGSFTRPGRTQEDMYIDRDREI